MKRSYIIFGGIGILVVFVLVALFVISSGYYPIAIVNGHPISAVTFRHNQNAAFSFARHREQVQLAGVTQLPPETARTLSSGVLERLVENVIIHQAAQVELGADYQSLIAQHLSKYASDSGIGIISQELYGLTENGFTEYVLIPESEKDLLAGRLLLRDVVFTNWLKQQKQSARVHIFSWAYRWQDGKVEAK